MNKSWWITSVAACSLALPAPVLAADPVAPAPKKPAKAAPLIRDVALSKTGEFAGRVVDGQGRPLDGVLVKLVRGEKEVAQTTADTDGRFKFASLKGGVYQVQTPQSQATYRLWSADVAPAQALRTVVMNGANPVVRGQMGFVDPLTLTAVGLGTAGVIMGGIGISKLNDLEDDVNKIPTSP